MQIEMRFWGLTRNFKVSGLLEEKFEVVEVVLEEKFRVSHEVEDVSEHGSVTVDEVVLLQTVQHDGDAAVEEFRQSRLWVPENKITNGQIFETNAFFKWIG